MAMLDKKLEIFHMAATLKHFSEAAEALGMTQPNVTQQVAVLEKELNIALFDRSLRQLELTPAGEALLNECDYLFAEVAEIKRKLYNASGGIRHYKTGGTMTAGGYLLPEYAVAYMKANPLHNLCIHIANTREVSELLKSRSLDVALVEGPFDRNLFLSNKLTDDELVPVAAPGAVAKEFSLTEYLHDGGRFILRESGSGTRHYFDLFLKKNGLPQPTEDNVVEVNSFDAIKYLVRKGYGITVISELAVVDEIKSGYLVKSRFTEGAIARSMNFIYLPNENVKFAERFITFCKSKIRK
ncbi:MAG: LysR family transcriptional regulator [Victivallaceae bacterium]|nr:LysR family transcriptional regulator [Victivallaceae bacterium]MDD4180454.1 LysR family transcriptional regulator [Victivallaceae bacterium]